MKNVDEIKMLFEDNYSVVVDDVYEQDDKIWVSYIPIIDNDNKKYMANVVWYEDTNDESNTGWKIKRILKSDKLISWRDILRWNEEEFFA